MKYMLDTNICIFLINNHDPIVLRHLSLCKFEDVCISTVTHAELRYGVEKSTQVKKNEAALEAFLTPLIIMDFDTPASTIYGKVRASLESSGTPIGSLDMLIGAHAISAGTTLVTNNTREFKRIKGLKLADWTKP